MDFCAGMDISSLILWQDGALLAVNKPAGLLTIRDGYDPTLPYLHHLLNEAYGLVWVVHRLDKDTSGLVLFALSADSHRSLSLQFEHRVTQKEYHALCAGIPDWQEQTADLPLRVNGDRRHRTVIDEPRGRPASTGFRLLRASSRWEAALLSAHPSYWLYASNPSSPCCPRLSHPGRPALPQSGHETTCLAPFSVAHRAGCAACPAAHLHPSPHTRTDYPHRTLPCRLSISLRCIDVINIRMGNGSAVECLTRCVEKASGSFLRVDKQNRS